MASPVLNYRQKQGPLPAGHIGRGTHFQGLTFLNPCNPQVNEITIDTADAAAWSIDVSVTGGPVTTLGFAGDAAEAVIAANLIAAWNANPSTKAFGEAVSTGADVVEIRFTDKSTAFTTVVTPGGIGAETTVVTADSGFDAFYGHWAFRPLTASVTAANARTLVNPVGPNVLENVAGIVTFPQASIENRDVRSSAATSGFYRSGDDVACSRRGYIWVPVTVAVKPGDPVHAIVAGGDAGKTTNTGAVDMSSIASFISVAAAGETAEIELTLA